MKGYLTTVLTLACATLVVVLFVIKGGDNTQHEKDVGAVADFSNRLDSAQTQLAICNGTILTLSNNLDQSRSVSLTLSNQLTEAESTIALNAEQITNLTRQVADVGSESQVLGRRVMDLTNQVSSLTARLASTETNLSQANKDYALLENRLRRDVAERVVVERKFDNLLALEAQMQYLKKHPAEMVSADSIYAGLDVEVKSNAFHVVSPN
jgi:chromosome segregation ATPase